jgi:membrane associated rhomboid family serine protease
MSEPDLFVVCKNCSSEVSPYVTECPYCGQRVRKRAPKLERGAPTEPKQKRFRSPTLPRLRRDEVPGIAPETRPVATFALIAVALLATLVARSTIVAPDVAFSLIDMGALVPIADDWWRVVTTPFLYDNLGYGFVALTAVGVFGMHIERRFGPVAVVLVFILCGAAGAGLANAAGALPALGGNGAALGLLTAWLVDDRAATARGDRRGNDMLGVAVFAAVLFGLSLADTEASIVAAVGGMLAGSICGVVMAMSGR